MGQVATTELPPDYNLDASRVGGVDEDPIAVLHQLERLGMPAQLYACDLGTRPQVEHPQCRSRTFPVADVGPVGGRVVADVVRVRAKVHFEEPL